MAETAAGGEDGVERMRVALLIRGEQLPPQPNDMWGER